MTGKDYMNPCMAGQDKRKKEEGGGEQVGLDLHFGVEELKQGRDSHNQGNWLGQKHLRLSEEGEAADL